MKISNHHNIPEAYVNMANQMIRKPDPNVFHVTELCDSPLIRILRYLHWDELEVDVTEMMWAIDGVVMHEFVAKYSPPHTLTEEELEVIFNGYTIKGRPDLYHIVEGKGIIEDHKNTSVYAFLLSEKEEWEQQLNMYAWLYSHYGLKVDELKIQAKLRDWMKSKTYRDSHYPDVPFITKSIPLWTQENTESFITRRIKAHCSPDPVCTDRERWGRSPGYAVMKPGKKRALRVLPRFELAEQWIMDNVPNGNVNIEERKREYIRCKDYCPVRMVCKYNPYKT